MAGEYQEYRGFGERSTFELRWVSLHGFLRSSGYELGARYQPDWVPSWVHMKKPPVTTNRFEDGVEPVRWNVLNAVRALDSMHVCLKKIEENDASEDHAQYFSRIDDPRNHCCAIIDVLHPPERPDWVIIVMPRYVKWNVAPFRKIGEAVDFFTQVFEGLSFMHEHNVAHLDIGTRNIVMDGLHLFEEPWHADKPGGILSSGGPRLQTERHASLRPVRYYFIDFESAVRFHSHAHRQHHVREKRADRTVPEERGDQRTEPCDPFAVDVYCLGNLIRAHWMEAYHNVGFMHPLVGEMMDPDPSRRPTAQHVVARFAAVRATLSPKDLRRSLSRNMDYFTDRVFERQLLAMIKRENRDKAHAAGRPYGFKEHVLYLFGRRPKPPQPVSVAQREREALQLVLGI